MATLSSAGRGTLQVVVTSMITSIMTHGEYHISISISISLSLYIYIGIYVYIYIYIHTYVILITPHCLVDSFGRRKRLKK